MKTNLRMRLCSLGEGGYPVGVLPGKSPYINMKVNEEGSGLVSTGRGTRRLGDWISGTRDAAA